MLQLDCFQFGSGMQARLGGGDCVKSKVPRWDPARKADYGAALCSEPVAQEGFVQGTLAADVAPNQLVGVIRDAVCGVFGVVQPQRCPAHGRRPKPVV